MKSSTTKQHSLDWILCWIADKSCIRKSSSSTWEFSTCRACYLPHCSTVCWVFFAERELKGCSWVLFSAGLCNSGRFGGHPQWRMWRNWLRRYAFLLGKTLLWYHRALRKDVVRRLWTLCSTVRHEIINLRTVVWLVLKVEHQIRGLGARHCNDWKWIGELFLCWKGRMSWKPWRKVDYEARLEEDGSRVTSKHHHNWRIISDQTPF